MIRHGKGKLMKALKSILIFCLAALQAGCFAHDGAELLMTEETVPSQVETTAPITEEPSEAAASFSAPEETEREEDFSWEELPANSGYDFRELNRPPETENPTMAEQIYRTLYDFADFYHYRFCYMAFFVDRNDTISVERVTFRSNRDLEDSPDRFGRQTWEKYYRVTGGRITTAKEYFYRLCQCVSDHYLADSDSDGFETAFQLSDGNLYLTEYALDYCPRAPASSVLDKITQIGEDRLLLEFTTVTKSLSPDDDTVYTGHYTVTMCYEHDRWKVDECAISDMDRLWNEIIQGGTNQESPKTDLPEQIERCLRESGLMEPAQS